jgi:hypothetical protein
MAAFKTIFVWDKESNKKIKEGKGGVSDKLLNSDKKSKRDKRRKKDRDDFEDDSFDKV